MINCFLGGSYLGFIRTLGMICDVDMFNRFCHKAPTLLPDQMLDILTQTVLSELGRTGVLFPNLFKHVGIGRYNYKIYDNEFSYKDEGGTRNSMMT